MMAAIPPAAFLSFFSVCLNADKAEGKIICLDIEFADGGESYFLSVDNSVLNYGAGHYGADADVTLCAPRLVLYLALLGFTNIQEGVRDGSMTFSGDEARFSEFVGLFDQFEPGFNIVTP
jgi:alkyl sulfatase BDS1-like metallo-beta-lactamase superfamily hydrolase